MHLYVKVKISVYNSCLEAEILSVKREKLWFGSVAACVFTSFCGPEHGPTTPSMTPHNFSLCTTKRTKAFL